MRIVLQRVKKASVSVSGAMVGSIGPGLLILLGIHKDDTPAQADFLVDKCAGLRIFADDAGKMNRSLADAGGGALVVSQFTLYGDCSRGRRPSFTDAADADKGRTLYEYFVSRLRQLVPGVATGVFGAMMDVELINDGPVTFVLDS
jgi:D-tyrosyl-tRNA(Tyr) deacylase